MRAWLCCTLLMVSIWAALWSACIPMPGGGRVVSQNSHVRVSESAVGVYSLVVSLTLEHFWNLASLQVRDPAAASRLLATNPREPAKTLQALNVGFDVYQQQLGQAAQVKPIVLFLPHGADPGEEARRHGLAISPWPPQTPPAFFSGPKVDTLILFEPVAGARREPRRGGPVALARIASAAGWTGLALAEGAAADPLRLYRVQPREWKKGVVFEHTRCMSPDPDAMLVTNLFYQGGYTDHQETRVTDKSWAPCTLAQDSKLRAATVKQRPSGRKPGQPVIVAGSYVLNPLPGPFLSDWIAVK